jgi:hypothetical protein
MIDLVQNIKPISYVKPHTVNLAKLLSFNEIVSIQQIIDTRRNIEELLVSLVIEKKI